MSIGSFGASVSRLLASTTESGTMLITDGSLRTTTLTVRGVACCNAALTLAFPSASAIRRPAGVTLTIVGSDVVHTMLSVGTGAPFELVAVALRKIVSFTDFIVSGGAIRMFVAGFVITSVAESFAVPDWA